MKVFKDPIYGYINIPKEITDNIIDTPEFQRLKFITQTSYVPLYSSALHNRFTHSLGVYYLGQKAWESIHKNSKNILKEHGCAERTGFLFTLACLLHDVGHAPFSHSSEDFFLDKNKSIDKKLIAEVNDPLFENDLKNYHTIAKAAKPHEIMSAIVALVSFSHFFENAEERSFFARCITGYQYSDSDNKPIHAIHNAFIKLLNSDTIDVDKLDYLIRDSYVTGYKSITIDHHRLIDSLILANVQTESSASIQLAFKKSALSVIENVIYAHDAEKKWIQSHPVVQYEVFLIKRIVSAVIAEYKRMNGKNLFSLESLLPNTASNNSHYNDAIKGIDLLITYIEEHPKIKSEIFENIKNIKQSVEHLSLPTEISLLCDDDIIYLSKLIDQPCCKELFDRSLRRHPIWKSESEYKVFLDGYIGDNAFQLLKSQIEIINRFLNEESSSKCIDNKSIKQCEDRIEEINESEVLTDADKNDMLERYGILLKWFKCFKRIAEENELKDFDFLIIPTEKFESNFNKDNIGKMLIYFPETQQTYYLNQLLNLFFTKKPERKNFFYIFYKRTDNKKIDITKAGKEIAKIVLEN